MEIKIVDVRVNGLGIGGLCDGSGGFSHSGCNWLIWRELGVFLGDVLW
jgi:hypothetical protein